MTTDLLILGGGIAGLGAAAAAHEAGLGCLVIEAAPRPGGLLDSFEIDGYRFDNAAHLSFTTEPEALALFDRTPSLTHDAVSYCWDHGRWLRHPVQNNLFPLPVDERIALIEGLVAAPNGPIANYQDWLVQQYGLPIATRWPLVYTEKYWSLPASSLGTDWIGPRMRKAALSEVLHGAMSEDAPPTYYIRQMRYPQRGGYRAFLDPLIQSAEILCNATVSAVDPVRHTVSLDDGSSLPYRRLISTLPLPALISMIPDVPAPVRADAASLLATSVDLVSVALTRPPSAPSLWFYVYDRDILAARIHVPSWKSPDNVPAGCGSLQFETYASARNPMTIPPPALIENSLDAMERMGLADRASVAFTHHKHIAWGNVVFDLGMERRRDRVRAFVAGQGIVLAGRFGEWGYLWSDQALLSGRRAVGKALDADRDTQV
jgi:protoporphyrinogen oxidase